MTIRDGYYCTYVLYSPTYGKIYIGSTGSLIQRFYSHNYLEKKGWTLAYRPWIVIFVEFHSTKSLALKREKQLKQANWRQKIKWSLENDFPLLGYIEI